MQEISQDDRVLKPFIADVLEGKMQHMTENENEAIRYVFDKDAVFDNKCRYRRHNDIYPSCGLGCKWKKHN